MEWGQIREIAGLFNSTKWICKLNQTEKVVWRLEPLLRTEEFREPKNVVRSHIWENRLQGRYILNGDRMWKRIYKLLNSAEMESVQQEIKIMKADADGWFSS